MKLTFRTKLMIVVGTTAMAFIILIGTGAILTRGMEKELTKIQEYYIPILELGPELEAALKNLRRGIQDSVAAQDIKALEKTRILKDVLLSSLSGARKITTPALVNELTAAIEDYYSLAHEVSRALIAGETGIKLVNTITLMQAKQAVVETLLKKITVLDRGTLMGTFLKIAKTQATSGRILIAVSMSCLITVLFLSLALSRSVLRSFAELTSGFTRFGQGNFSQPILVTSHDELEDLAKDANQMASRIQGLLKELESFSYTVAHDLRAPLRGMLGFSSVILEDHGSTLPGAVTDSLKRVIESARKMGILIDSLLNFSKLSRKEMKKEPVDLSVLAEGVLSDLRFDDQERKVAIKLEKNLIVQGDSQLLRIVLVNLLGNAWKFTSKKPQACIEIGVKYQNSDKIYFVRDNGAGFDMKYAGKLFGTFQRLHSAEEFHGTGIGLATVQSILNRHGGDIWAEAKPDLGAVFYFTLWKKIKSAV